MLPRLMKKKLKKSVRDLHINLVPQQLLRHLQFQGLLPPHQLHSPRAVPRVLQNQNLKASFSELIRGNQDDDDDDEQRNTFAGGETSGLEVTDPNNSNSLIRDLLEKAQRGGQRPSDTDEDTEEQNKHHFVGKGYRLGSSVDEAPRVVEDIQEDLPSKPKKVTRQITFWKEGFQVGEGELFRYDDPSNSYYLNELNQGRAPLKLAFERGIWPRS